MNNYYTALFKGIYLDFNRNKSRTFLTSLGISIGVFSVIMLVALGLGLKNFISSQFEDLGANVIAVFPGSSEGGVNFSALAGSKKFDEQDAKGLSRIREIDYIVPAVVTNATFTTASTEENGTVFGVSEDYSKLFGLELIEGNFFNKSDVSSSAKVGYMAQSMAIKLFDSPQNAIGKTVNVKNLRIKVIGVIKNVGNPERDKALIIPYTTTYGTLNPRKEFFLIYTGISDKEHVEIAKKHIEDEMLKRYEEDEFSVVEPSDILKTLDQIFASINIVLVAVGSISLIVGGIGIMNIMYANAVERTKEIGIKRAVGATKRNILVHFIVESTLLSLIGGLAGLLIAFIIVLIVRPFFPLELNMFSVIMALGISTLIGVFFGVFPARRAANLTPIEAIRD